MTQVLVDVDERGRASLKRLGVASGSYLAELVADGSVLLRPAEVMTRAQATLLRDGELMASIDSFAANLTTGVRSGRLKRQ